jgi:hypothetical protein
MNSCHSSGLYLMFIVVIWPSAFLQALSSSCVMKIVQNLFGGNEMLSLSQYHSQDSTVEVLNTTVALYSLTMLGLLWGQKSLCVWSSVDQQRLHSGKIPSLWSRWLQCFFKVFSSSLPQSREKLLGGFGKGRLLQLGTGRIADDIFGYSIYFFFLVIPFWIGGTIQKLQPVMWFVSSLHIMGTANSMEHPLRFTQALIYDEKDKGHEAHVQSRAQLLSWSTLQVKCKKCRLVLLLKLKHASLKQMWFLCINNRSYPHTYWAFLTRLEQRRIERCISLRIMRMQNR